MALLWHEVLQGPTDHARVGLYQGVSVMPEAPKRLAPGPHRFQFALGGLPNLVQLRERRDQFAPNSQKILRKPTNIWKGGCLDPQHSSRIHRGVLCLSQRSYDKEVTIARAIEELGRLRVGYAELGMHGDRQGSVKQQVHDGDTITVKAAGREPEDEIGNLAVRFLGVDAPEVSLPLPGQDEFVGIGDDRWKEYLKDPFRESFDPPLDGDLIEHLRDRVGPNAATNHARHAEEGHRALENLILKDLDELGQESADFRFFFVFAYEVMDGHARLLCYVNRFQPNENDPAPGRRATTCGCSARDGSSRILSGRTSTHSAGAARSSRSCPSLAARRHSRAGERPGGTPSPRRATSYAPPARTSSASSRRRTRSCFYPLSCGS